MSTRWILVGISLLLFLSLAGWLASHAWRASPPLDATPSAPVTVASSVEEAAAPPAEDRTPEIRGRVLDADGNVVVGATVRLVSASPPYSMYGSVESDHAGAFSFAHLGSWSVRVVAEHGADGVVTSSVLRAEAGQSLEITLVLNAASDVRGVVVDGQDHPVPGAVVSAEGIPWTITTTSDAAGAFLLTTVPDEATSLVAVARGFRSARVSLTPLAATDPRPERTVRLVLTAASPVDGEVHDEDGEAVSAAVVACEGQSTETRAQSGADGLFQLAPSAIGCDVVAEHAEYAPSAPVSVVEGKHLVLQLKSGGSIEGVVVDERGAGVSPFTLGIESFVPERGRMRPSGGARNEEDLRGGFRWEKLAPGSYVLTASAAGRPAVRSEPIDVHAGAVSRGVRIVLAPGGAIAGHVYGPAGVLAGAKLRFDAVSSVIDSKVATQTDESGQYRLEEAPQGPFTLRVEKDGFRTKLVSGLHVAPGSTLRQDVTLASRDGGAGFELGGIGAQLSSTPAGITVQSVFPGDPAAVAGLRAGDRIVRVDGEPVDGLSVADLLQHVRGEPGTSVGLSAERPATKETLDLVIVRRAVSH